MKIEINIHPIQGKILKILSLKNCTFTELNTEYLPNDKFSFHIRRLKKLNLIRKDEDGMYSLTDEGKNLSLIVNTSTNTIDKFPKVSMLVICEIDSKYLIQQRLISPFKGYYEFPSKRVTWGKNILECAQDFFFNETGIKGSVEFKGVNHKVDLNEDGIIDDKYFFIFKMRYKEGSVKEKFEEGLNFLMSKDEILLLNKTHYDLKNTFDIYESDGLLEISDKVEGY